MVVRISDSSWISYFLETFFFSSSDRREIILENEGEIGCSNLAARSIETVANRHI